MPTRSHPSPALPLDPTAAGLAPRRRLGASDLATHLDMAVIGDVCLVVGLAGYRAVVSGFLADESGSQAALLAVLDRADTRAVAERAHAVKGAAASLGLRAVQDAADRLEREADLLDAATCTDAAAQLRSLLETTRGLLHCMGFA